MKRVNAVELKALPYGTLFIDSAGYIFATAVPPEDWGHDVYWYETIYPNFYGDGTPAGTIARDSAYWDEEPFMVLESEDIDELILRLKIYQTASL